MQACTDALPAEQHDAEETGDDAHAETDCENLRPEEVEFAINQLAGSQPQPLEHGEIAREPDADRGEDDVGRDRERELQPRKYQYVTGLEHQTFTPIFIFEACSQGVSGALQSLGTRLRM